MIGISGVARAGKDTLARNLKTLIEKEYDVEVEIVHLAQKLKSDLDKLIACNFHFQVDTDNTNDKNLIRPILVAYGEAMKKKWGKEIWMKKLHDEIKSRKEKKFFIVSDVRFDFEADYIKENFDGFNIHISKLDKCGKKTIGPANDVEEKNDPLVRFKCDIQYTWPEYHPDRMHECEQHANIIWQMAENKKGEFWKKIYS